MQIGTEQTEGWQVQKPYQPNFQENYHYIREGRALCGAVGSYEYGLDEDNPEQRDPADCADCAHIKARGEQSFSPITVFNGHHRSQSTKRFLFLASIVAAVCFLLTNTSVDLDTKVQAQTQYECITRCNQVKSTCRDRETEAYVTCGQQGGSEATCRDRAGQVYLSCMSEQHCQSCFNRVTSFYCECGALFWEEGGGSACPGYEDQIDQCQAAQHIWDFDTCSCDTGIGPHTPILIDTAGNGFQLTSLVDGVSFSLRPGVARKISWTSADSDDAWLSLDRNGNGVIDDGSELFGNFTPQPKPAEGTKRNGFLALRVFDQFLNGGNEDGVIDRSDEIYRYLRLWRDANHNGISEAPELHSLSAMGIDSIDLEYKFAGRRDRFGNYFLYRSKISDGTTYQLGRWAQDVDLLHE